MNIWNCKMLSYYVNEKINSEMDTDSDYVVHRDTSAELIIPHCMFKSILSLCTFGQFSGAKTHVYYQQKVWHEN